MNTNLSHVGQRGRDHEREKKLIKQITNLVVGSTVEHNRKAVLSRETGEASTEGQFADGNAHSKGAQISQAEDSLSVGHHDRLEGKATRSKGGHHSICFRN